MASVLIVGGAGYVGSAVAAHLIDRGDRVWVLDDLSTGHRSLLLDPVVREEHFVEARAGNRPALEAIFRHCAEKEKRPIDVVLHFAAKSLVGESVKFPELYRENNVDQTRLLLDAMVAHGVKRFVFSSTAAVYGDPGDREIDEDLEKNPINPYGETKLEAERLLAAYGEKHGLRAIALRYFNAAGAEDGGRVGEIHDPETHLIPNVLAAGLAGRPVSIFGDDYPTPDGTCVRDYVHVSDLAQAHAAAADRMLAEAPGTAGFEAFNLGSAAGYSVKEVVAEAERVLGNKIAVRVEPRRPGDPAKLVAIADRARKTLGFVPRPDALASILKTALAWEKKKQAPKKAVFLDRDGTLNFDPGYLSDHEKFELIPGVPAALKRLADAGYLLVVVSNQSGVGRGKIEIPQLRRIHAKLDRLLAGEGVRIHHYALCFHHPDEDCECRKPKPKLVLDAAAKYRIDLARSFMVGDKLSDVECGRNAGVGGSFLVGSGYGAEEVKLLPSPDGVYFPDLAAVADRILGGKSK
ncbi:MAG: UDP-glucose 4-epimerase GalE [Bdellovibrionales bacterium]|nr:UDP-glucose 4-epimerase GalE [Bdellovibrionales bacterium]